MHVCIGWKRSAQNIFHAFAIISFVDELAAAGRYPVEYKLALLEPDRIIDLTKSQVQDYIN